MPRDPSLIAYFKTELLPEENTTYTLHYTGGKYWALHSLNKIKLSEFLRAYYTLEAVQAKGYSHLLLEDTFKDLSKEQKKEIERQATAEEI